MSNVHKVTKENFEETLKSSKFVFVDFYADWCGPCRAMSPVLDELSKEYEGRVVFGKVNVDEEEEISSEYKISSIPNMKLFHNGEIIAEYVGSRPKEKLKKEIEETLGNYISD